MSENEKQPLSFKVGQVINAVSAKLEESFTQRPPRYTEPALLDDMVNAHKFATEPNDRTILKETEGLGTSRTREPIITGLTKRGLLEKRAEGKQKVLVSTPFARQLITMLPRLLVDPVLTAKWEQALAMVERGEATQGQVLEAQRKFVQHVIDDARGKLGGSAFSGMTPVSTTQKKGGHRRKSR